ncbi:hypothetical protein GINT2_001650 [Glugoides intestinalis]
MGLEEIEKAINKFSGAQKAELIAFYRSLADEYITEETRIDSKRIKIVCDISKYISVEEKNALFKKAIDIKAAEVQTYVLNNFKSDFYVEKAHFSAFSGWVMALVKEIKKTFYSSEGVLLDDELTEHFHKKICKVLKLIFCSGDKFKSAGNQLILDLMKYFKSFPGFDEEKRHLLSQIKKNFEPGKIMPKEKIEELFNTFKG